MPSYTYKCDACGNIIVESVPLAERDDERACSCGKPMRRKFIPPTVIYKGSGFYETDKVLSEPTEDDLYPDPLDDNPYNDVLFD